MPAVTPMSAGALGEHIGISRQAVLNWLRRLEAEGVVEVTGPSRVSPKNQWKLSGGQNASGG